MPRLKPSANGTRRGLNPSNGLVGSSRLAARRSIKLSPARPISEPVAPYTFPLARIAGCQYDVVWSGVGPLTDWPMRDWVLLTKPGYEPIWDRQPLTASMLWARLMRDGCGDDDTMCVRPFQRPSKPTLVDLDQHERFERTWAQLSKVLALPPLKPPTVSPRTPKRWRALADPPVSPPEEQTR